MAGDTNKAREELRELFGSLFANDFLEGVQRLQTALEANTNEIVKVKRRLEALEKPLNSSTPPRWWQDEGVAGLSSLKTKVEALENSLNSSTPPSWWQDEGLAGLSSLQTKIGALARDLKAIREQVEETATGQEWLLNRTTGGLDALGTEVLALRQGAAKFEAHVTTVPDQIETVRRAVTDLAGGLDKYGVEVRQLAEMRSAITADGGQVDVPSESVDVSAVKGSGPSLAAFFIGVLVGGVAVSVLMMMTG